MPVNDPGWFDGLPENVTEAGYGDLPEEISGATEIVHGPVINYESPTSRHNRIRVGWPTPWKPRDHRLARP
jgi:hypothetical protein